MKQNLDEIVLVRVFPEQQKRISKVLQKARDRDNFPKYDNRSHLIRCAVQRLLREEEQKIGGR